MEKKKNIWNLNSLWAILGFRNIGNGFFWKFYPTKFSSGFTLIELLVAVAIIGVLAGSLFFAINPGAQLAKAHDAQRKNDLEQMRNALDAYYNDNNRYPDGTGGTIAGLAWGSPWPPYMAKIPKDPLSGQDYRYESPDDGSSYRLYAKLERCSDSQGAVGVDCLRSPENYSINSSNLAMLESVPTATPIPSPTPTPTPVSPTPTPTPVPPTPTPTPTPVPPTPTPTPLPSKKVFITSAMYQGNLGGLSDADLKCQGLANIASLGGTWKAWLSDASTSAASRLSHSAIPYKLLDGTLIANNWSDLITNKSGNYLRNSITKDQNNLSALTQYVWTNTEPSGNIVWTSPSSACNNWSTNSGSGAYSGRVGYNFNADISWTNAWSVACSTTRRLYCFEQ